MRPTGQVHQVVFAHRRTVAAVAVGVQRAGEPCEQPSGDLARAGRVVVEHHDGRLRARAHQRPQLRLRLRRLPRLFQHLHRGLVHQQVRPPEELLVQQIHQRHHQLAHPHHPPRQRRARQLHPDAPELLLLAVQRQPIDVLRGDDEREQPGAREALRQRLRRQRGGAKMPLAARAAVLAADMTQHPHLRRHDVELLAHHLGEAFKLDPVMRAGALGFRELMFDVDPLERIGQRGAHRARAPMGRDLGAGVGLGFLGRGHLGLVEQPELCVGELLRRCPEAPRQQQPYLLVQLLDGRLVPRGVRSSPRAPQAARRARQSAIRTAAPALAATRALRTVRGWPRKSWPRE